MSPFSKKGRSFNNARLPIASPEFISFHCPLYYDQRESGLNKAPLNITL